ncbi:MAG: selenocysteine-specific translation elongation factor [Pseudomonadales bacterium]|nr:selenocysteine-specific translation elongation factor [Pseudomonadales bacterium]
MIVTLAGHVDHGKTSIVRALTGTDTDRLAEEKERGLTIDLGFAYSDLGGHRIGFVDVPGHHRFIHNMVAGVAGMQHALLVIAADDGVMPQTREHLQILSLLGLKRGTIALSKIDRVSDLEVNDRRDEIKTFVEDSFLETADIIAISSVDGQGIDVLRDTLATAAAHHSSERQLPREFRLAVDRSFSTRGVGTVVTGTVVEGQCAVDDQLVLGSDATPVRVRSLHVQNRPASKAEFGDRTAINLVGVDAEKVQRGDWITKNTVRLPTSNVSVQLSVLRDFPRTVRHRSPVHIYHATSHHLGRVALLESNAADPGSEQLADLLVESELHVKVGDSLIIRDHDLGRTMGGGLVIALDEPSARRRSPARLDMLIRLRSASIQQDPIASLLDMCRHGPVHFDRFRRSWNLTESDAERLRSLPPLTFKNDFVLHDEYLTIQTSAFTATLEEHHRLVSDSEGIELESLATLVGQPMDASRIVLACAVVDGTIKLKGGRYALAHHHANVPLAVIALFEKVKPLLDQAQPPSSGDLAKQLGIPLSKLEKELPSLAKFRLCIQISTNRYYLPDQIAQLTQTAIDLAEHDDFTVRAFRDSTGVGRNIVIEILEYFDRKGFTRRSGDSRQIVGTADQVLT